MLEIHKELYTSYATYRRAINFPPSRVTGHIVPSIGNTSISHVHLYRKWFYHTRHDNSGRVNIHVHCTHETAMNADCVRTARLYCSLGAELDRVSEKKERKKRIVFTRNILRAFDGPAIFLSDQRNAVSNCLEFLSLAYLTKKNIYFYSGYIRQATKIKIGKKRQKRLNIDCFS